MTNTTDTGSRAFDVGVAFHNDFWDIGEVVFKTRALRAFENAATRYPIHRFLRCAVPRPMENIFDDLALGMGLAPQRMESGVLLLDGPEVFVQAVGKRKANYCSCAFNIWTDTKERATQLKERILQTLGERFLPEEMFVIDWQFQSRGTLTSCSFEERAHEALLDEAYPSLGRPVDTFIDDYLKASESVLILMGAPGTGKTRLVRSILGALSRRKRDSAEIMYTADKATLESDEIFVDFITGSHDAFVIEDADHMLKARASGNLDLHRFLAVADGVVRAQGRKIIFTTNLPNVRDLDEALLRPGRCYALVQIRSLVGREVDLLLERLTHGDTALYARAQSMLIGSGECKFPLAKVYRALHEARRDQGEVADGESLPIVLEGPSASG